MTSNATPQVARRGGDPLDYARPIARSGVAIGTLILLASIWITFDQFFGAVTTWAGMTPGYWKGWDSMLIDGILNPAAAYLLAIVLILSSERLAPFLLPRTWWH
jgi:hypothetical protein